MAVVLALTFILIFVCSILAYKRLSPVRAGQNHNGTVVILDDGCPDTSVTTNFRVACESIFGAAGQGVHSSMLLKTLINFDRDFGLPIKDLIFVNIADVDGRSSKLAIAEGLRLAKSFNPLAINLSYSLSRRDTEIDHALQDLADSDIKVFVAYSNLFFEEDSFPASSKFSIGVKIGESTARENHNTIVVQRELVEDFSQEQPSTSAASILALAYTLICEVKPESTDSETAICKVLGNEM
ncbi:hypothetical protein KRX54_00115 [Actinomycetaceae bacterium TAE3-ERU4]|nr:hypothetical protein [Actinomycetaceae bacterium TAE3-ERU4]